MDFVSVTLNWVATLAAFLLHLRRRPILLLDPAWAFLAGFFINYCIRPLVYTMDSSVGLLFEGDVYPVGMVRNGFHGAVLFALLGLVGFVAEALFVFIRFDEIDVFNIRFHLGDLLLRNRQAEMPLGFR